MLGPIDSVQDQEFWGGVKKQESLFPQDTAPEESTDLLLELDSKLDELEDLCGRLSYSMREIGQVLKAKNVN